MSASAFQSLRAWIFQHWSGTNRAYAITILDTVQHGLRRTFSDPDIVLATKQVIISHMKLRNGFCLVTL